MINATKKLVLLVAMLSAFMALAVEGRAPKIIIKDSDIDYDYAEERSWELANLADSIASEWAPIDPVVRLAALELRDASSQLNDLLGDDEGSDDDIYDSFDWVSDAFYDLATVTFGPRIDYMAFVYNELSFAVLGN